MRLLTTIVTVLLLAITSGCLYVVRYDGTYQGKVIDQDTREPIEGVVVLGTWSVMHSNVAGGSHSYYDARETLTDKNGEFSISGQGLRIMSNLEPMRLLIYKSGYDYMSGPWNSVATSIKNQNGGQLQDNAPIFSMKKLSGGERHLPTIPIGPSVPNNKMKLLISEINKERLKFGLKQFIVGD